MYVLIISRGYPDEKYKMNGIFEFDQAKAIASLGHKVVYAALDMRSIRRIRKLGRESFSQDGLFVESLNIPCGNIPNFLFNKIGVVGIKKLFNNIVAKHGMPDIIHSHFTQMGYFSTKALKEYGVPIVITEHSSLIHKEIINGKLYTIADYAYQNADSVVTVSNSLKNSVYDHFKIHSITINNIVDTDLFTFTNNRTRENNEFTIISTGRLIKSKRMDILIESFRRAFSENNYARLIIFGDGPERVRLTEQINKSGMKDKIIMMGMQPRKIIAEYMKNADCFALVSETETFGVAYIEALASGLPIIAARSGGPEDFIDDSNGLLVDVNDVEDLTKALKSMHMNIRKYVRDNISNNAKAKFSGKFIARRLERVYIEVLSGRKNDR